VPTSSTRRWAPAQEPGRSRARSDLDRGRSRAGCACCGSAPPCRCRR
jgi:hypothetical protein